MTNTADRTTKSVLVPDGRPSPGTMCRRLSGREGLEVGAAIEGGAAQAIRSRMKTTCPPGGQRW